MRKSKKQIASIYVMAFLIPTIVVLAVMIYQGITPFGDNSVFIWDAKLQHKDYYGYLWDVFHGNASIEFSAGKSLGGRMLGLIGFYISSPLNILLLFFEKNQIPTFMAIMIVIRIGLCGLTSQFYIRSRFQLSVFPAILLSTAYALMEYNVYYCRNVMWLDGVILLPLIATGVWKLVSREKKVLLWGSVALAIIANWYTGYMVCLMSGIYFLYEYSVYYDYHPINKIREGWHVILRYVIVMLLSVMASLVILLPACMALVGGKATHNSVGLTGIVHFDIIHFFSGFEINAAGNNQMAPVIFCSGLILVCSFYYFFTSHISKNEKIFSGLFALVLLESFCLQDLELLWTAFVRSTSYYFRFSFVVPFFMLVLSSRAWKVILERGIQKKAAIWTIGSILAVFYILFRSKELNTSFVTLIMYMVFLVLTIILVVLYKYHNFRIRQCSVILMSLMLIFELSYNTNRAFREYKASATVFSDYELAMEDVIEELNDKSERAFYRFEKNESYLTISDPESKTATCESLFYNYNSIEHYSSAYDEKVDNFLAKMGYSDLTSESVFLCETYWNSPMILTDSLLSIRYAVLSSPTYGYKILDMVSKLPFEDSDIYENNYALPLGYNVSSNMTDVQFGDNPYDNQMLLVNSMIGEKMDLYNSVDTKFVGFDEKDEIWELKVLSDGPVYLYIDSASVHGNLYNDNCEVYINGKLLQKTCSRFMMNSMLLGEYNSGETIEIKICHKNDERDRHVIYSAQLDTDQFETAVKKLKSGYASTLNIEGNKISGNYSTKTDTTVLLTIPFEENWTLYVDGKKTEIYELAGTFIGFDLSAGTHNIEIEYHTPGLGAGIVLSGVGVMLFIFYVVVSSSRFRKQRRKTK